MTNQVDWSANGQLHPVINVTSTGHVFGVQIQGAQGEHVAQLIPGEFGAHLAYLFSNAMQVYETLNELLISGTIPEEREGHVQKVLAASHWDGTAHNQVAFQ